MALVCLKIWHNLVEMLRKEADLNKVTYHIIFESTCTVVHMSCCTKNNQTFPCIMSKPTTNKSQKFCHLQYHSAYAIVNERSVTGIIVSSYV